MVYMTLYMPWGDLAELELRAKRRLTEGSMSVVIMHLPSDERTQSKKSMPSKQKNQEAWLTIGSPGRYRPDKWCIIMITCRCTMSNSTTYRYISLIRLLPMVHLAHIAIENPLLDQEDKSLALALSVLSAEPRHILKNCVPSLLTPPKCPTTQRVASCIDAH